MAMKNNHSQSARRRVWPVVLLASVITVAALAWLYGPDVMNHFRASNTQNSLQQLYKGADKSSIWDALFPSACAEEMEAISQDAPVVHSDFAALYAQNPHLVGWLNAGDRIDYPVVQYDNSFYLEHNFFGDADINGTLFLNEANQLDPRDSVLLIHGHNMRSGDMFGSLNRYREESYLAEYPIVTFRTISDDQDVYYTPIAAFDASMTTGAAGYFDITRIRFDFEPDENGRLVSSELEEYIAEMRGMSLWNAPVEADSTDEYIALVTCSYIHDDGRFTLVCRKLRADETADGIRALYAGQ